MLRSVHTALFALFSLAVIVITTPGCSSSRSAGRAGGEVRSERDREEEEEEEEEEEAREMGKPAPPMVWGSGMRVEALDRPGRTVRFNLGSPLLLRIAIDGPVACAPFEGRPFFFDATGAQLGWGFEEVADSLLAPSSTGHCQRIILLSSEQSNRLAEGTYTLKTLIHLENGAKVYSDTITIEAVRSSHGADVTSYSRFLMEQIIKRSPLLNDPETLHALFADGTPKSAESEVYRAVILQRAGDAVGAAEAIKAARASISQGGHLAPPADHVLNALERQLAGSRK